MVLPQKSSPQVLPKSLQNSTCFGAGWPASLGMGEEGEGDMEGKEGRDELKETCPQQTGKWPPRFLAVAVGGSAGSSHRWGSGGWGSTAGFRTSLPPRQLSAQPWLSRGKGLDKGSAGVPAGAGGLCIQVFAPRSKARPCAGPQRTDSLKRHFFEAAPTLTLSSPEPGPRSS